MSEVISLSRYREERPDFSLLPAYKIADALQTTLLDRLNDRAPVNMELLKAPSMLPNGRRKPPQLAYCPPCSWEESQKSPLIVYQYGDTSAVRITIPANPSSIIRTRGGLYVFSEAMLVYQADIMADGSALMRVTSPFEPWALKSSQVAKAEWSAGSEGLMQWDIDQIATALEATDVIKKESLTTIKLRRVFASPVLTFDQDRVYYNCGEPNGASVEMRNPVSRYVSTALVVFLGCDGLTQSSFCLRKDGQLVVKISPTQKARQRM